MSGTRNLLTTRIAKSPGRQPGLSWPWVSVVLTALALSTTSCTSRSEQEVSSEKILRLPIRSDGPKSLDPIRGSSVYDNQVSCQMYEPLLQYKYLVRPPTLEPLLLERMPEISEDGLTYHFQLKKGIYFHDDPCFPAGKGREMVATDVVYSWKRMADGSNLGKNWWLLEDTILGLEYFEPDQDDIRFNYDAEVEGLQVLDRYRFTVRLQNPVQRFMYVLAMYQTSVVAREAVEYYANQFGRHAVGSGPFVFQPGPLIPGQSIVLRKNPRYHHSVYPHEHMPEDKHEGLHHPSGTPLPIADRVEFTMFVEDQPMWLKFRSSALDYTQVPAEYFPAAFIKRTQKLKTLFRQEGIRSYSVPLLDFIFIGFNMEDDLLGGYSDQQKYLRQAICLALDWHERNQVFYNGLNVIYDGPIPPGLAGHPSDGKAPVSYRGRDVERARQLLAKAGYPNGQGLPRIDYYTSRGSNNKEQTEMLVRHLGSIGIRINPRLVDFSSLIAAVDQKKASFFAFAWGSDYPDAENNLALFYGPNSSPGANHFNYNRPEFDRLYEQIRIMPPSDQRTQLYEQMRDKVLEDAPYAGSMARTRYYLVNPRLKNFKPTENFYNWVKYLDVN